MEAADISNKPINDKHYVKHGGVVRINGTGPSLDPCK